MEFLYIVQFRFFTFKKKSITIFCFIFIVCFFRLKKNETDIDQMAQEEWLVSRNKISKFDELLDSWTMNLNKENFDGIPIINWIRAQLEAYKVIRQILLTMII